MTGDSSPNSPEKDTKFKSIKSQEVFPKQHLPENSDMFTIQKKGLVFLFLIVSFLMWFSNLPFFIWSYYMVYLLALQKVSPSHPTIISKGNTFSPLKDTTLRRTLGHTKARGPLSVNDNAMLDACATATRAFDTQDDSHGDAGTLIVFGAPTYLGLFCHFSGQMAPSVKQMTEAKGFAFWGWCSVTLVGWTR